MASASPPRAPSDIVDLLVVGGGINGTGIARDAAGRGLKVLLAERDDLAGFTSSSSTKLIHGGLRYLEYYEFRLVREAWPSGNVCCGSPPTSSGPCASSCPTTRACARPGSCGSVCSSTITWRGCERCRVRNRSICAAPPTARRCRTG